MLQDLPTEILQQVISHLLSASAVIALSLTHRSLHERISADDYAIFRLFVQKKFPTINSPPFWRRAAQELTSRSRAWDRKAFVATECFPDQVEPPAPHQNSGFAPVIDSHEEWTGGRLSDRRDILVIGMAGRLRIRMTENCRLFWSSWRTKDDHLATNDILDVRLLRRQKESSSEQVVLRRANGEIVKVEASRGRDRFAIKTKYQAGESLERCMDINSSADPQLALCNETSIQLFPVDSTFPETLPIEVLQLDPKYPHKHRPRCAKFLSSDHLAISKQFLEGYNNSPINTYHIRPEALQSSPSYTFHPSPLPSRSSCTSITPLSPMLLLSGWTSGQVNLFDARAGHYPTSTFTDTVDTGQILSLLAIGHERFLAGGSDNACLKTFDLRMPGAKTYSYLDAHLLSPPPTQPNRYPKTSNITIRDLDREINIFLSVLIHPPHNRHVPFWSRLPPQLESQRNLTRYHGGIHSLSTPSPTSSVIYAGICNHVIALDAHCTDDAALPDLLQTPATTNPTKPNSLSSLPPPILNLSAYPRPRSGHESTDPVLLHKQLSPPPRRPI